MNIFKILTLILQLVCLGISHAAGPYCQQDIDALVKIDKDMDHDNKLNWYDPKDGATPGDGGDWFGVIWQNGRVVEINLKYDRGLRGGSAGFGRLTYLRAISLKNNIRVNDISSFCSLNRLEKLDLFRCNIVNIDSLKGLHYLKELSLGPDNFHLYEPSPDQLQLKSKPRKNFEVLRGLINLEKLELIGCNVANTAIFSELINLKSLTLQNCNVNEVSFLRKLEKLEYVNMSRNHISDISPFDRLRNLRLLLIDDNEIVDLEPIAKLSNLERADISNNRIVSVIPLSELNALTYLDLSHNEIVDFNPLTKLSNLNTLLLSYNNIRYIPNFSPLSRLEYLHVDHNSITDISNANSLPDFTVIFLNGNSVKLSQMYDLVTRPRIMLGTQENVVFKELESSITIGQPLSFSSEVTVGRYPTFFSVFHRDGSFALPEVDYIVSEDGILSFFSTGEYRIKMINYTVCSKGRMYTMPPINSSAKFFDFENGIDEKSANVYTEYFIVR